VRTAAGVAVALATGLDVGVGVAVLTGVAVGATVSGAVAGLAVGLVVFTGPASGEHPVAAAAARLAAPPSRARREGRAMRTVGGVTGGQMAGTHERFGSRPSVRVVAVT